MIVSFLGRTLRVRAHRGAVRAVQVHGGGGWVHVRVVRPHRQKDSTRPVRVVPPRPAKKRRNIFPYWWVFFFKTFRYVGSPRVRPMWALTSTRGKSHSGIELTAAHGWCYRSFPCQATAPRDQAASQHDEAGNTCNTASEGECSLIFVCFATRTMHPRLTPRRGPPACCGEANETDATVDSHELNGRRGRDGREGHI